MTANTDVRDALNQAIEWLDPSPSDRNVDLVSCQNAYNDMITERSWTDDDKMTLASRLASSLEESVSISSSSHFQQWLECQMDLYRALIAASYLWIQLMMMNQSLSSTKTDDNIDNTTHESTKTTLQETIEICLLLLCLLCDVGNVTQIPHRILPSRYPLLQALLEEPLLPLETQEAREELWRCDSTGDACAVVIAPSLDEGDEDPMRDEDLLISFPTKKELLQEERTLIEMAQTPIPETEPGDDISRSITGALPMIGEPILQDNHILAVQIRRRQSPSSLVTMQQCMLQVHAYGVLLVVEKCHQLKQAGNPQRPLISTSRHQTLCLPHNFAIEGRPERGSFVLEVTSSSSSQRSKLLLKLTVGNLKQGLRILNCLQQTKTHLRAMNAIRNKLRCAANATTATSN